MGTIIRIFLFAFGVYCALAALLFFRQASYVYYPDRTIDATPAVRNLPYEEITFTTEDGREIFGWFVPAANAGGMVLFCHGNAGNISHRLDSLEIFHTLGLSTFIFDYRGYGRSTGKPGEEGTYRDADAAWRYLIEQRSFSPSEIILFGRSLGGAVASWLAQDHTPKALIVESCFTSVPDCAAEFFPIFPMRLLVRFRYTTAAYLGKIQCPVLIVHSRDDEIISFRHGDRLFAAAQQPKQFLTISGSHNDGFITSGRNYTDGLAAFLATLGMQ